MSATLPPPKTRSVPTVAGLIQRLDDIPPERIRMEPTPGTATEADVLKFSEEDDTVYELVDGTLVEKAMGFREAKLEGWFYFLITQFLLEHDLGEAVPGTGMIRLGKGKVRAPDVSVLLGDHVTTDEEDAANPIARTIADLVVEVISPSNTPKEMARKRQEYFKAGTTLVWQVYPKTRLVEVYTSPNRFRTLGIDDTLDGGALLPGFQLPLRTLFGRRTRSDRRRKK